MKRLSLFALIVITLSSFASAHEGSLDLFTDMNHDDCDRAVEHFVTMGIELFYYKSDAGPDGLNGCEFRIELEGDDGSVDVLPADWEDGVLDQGNLLTGIGLVFSAECVGAGQAYVHIGTLNFMSIFAPDGFKIKILPDPNAVGGDPNYPHITICNETKDKANVLGGWFIFAEGGCMTAAEPTSWGAIKRMF